MNNLRQVFSLCRLPVTKIDDLLTKLFDLPLKELPLLVLLSAYSDQHLVSLDQGCTLLPTFLGLLALIFTHLLQLSGHLAHLRLGLCDFLL